MGGDHAPRAVIDGAVMTLGDHPDIDFVLVGREEVIREELQRAGREESRRFRIHPASQVVGMGEKPAVALRTKKDSSLRVGANLVKEGKVDAFVSSGNTGALMATAKFVLKTLPGIDRPAIASMVPSITGQTLMLDLGANVDCSVAHLCQFAMMGEVYATEVLGMEKPRVGLLNIGAEAVKGNEMVRQAGERLRGSSDFFIGNVEATDIFEGSVDVVVCDGFVGNVSLKSTEGAARLLRHFLRESFNHSLFARLGYLLVRPVLKRFRDRFDPRAYNGAMLLGLNGVVVKSHGSADAYAFSRAIHVAEDLVANNVNATIQRVVTNLRNGVENDRQGETRP